MPRRLDHGNVPKAVYSGPDATNGATGPAGSQGATGATGAGATGATGSQGATGPGGGATGATGAVGATGPGGGATGATGAAGAAGVSAGPSAANTFGQVDVSDGAIHDLGSVSITAPAGPGGFVLLTIKEAFAVMTLGVNANPSFGYGISGVAFVVPEGFHVGQPASGGFIADFTAVMLQKVAIAGGATVTYHALAQNNSALPPGTVLVRQTSLMALFVPT
jgi:hypothetical protein